MGTFSTVKIAPASTDFSKLDLSHSHETTTDFGQINIINYLDANLGDKLNQDFRLFGRVAPMVFPTYASIKMRVLTVFVPYYLISDFAESYIAGIPFHSGRKATGLYIKVGDLARIFYSSQLSLYADVTADTRFLQEYHPAENSDVTDALYVFKLIRYKTASDRVPVTTYFRLTPVGKYLYKLFRQLGFDVPREVSMVKNVDGTPYSINWDKTLNAYPILCYIKAYADLLLPSSLYQTSNLVQYLAGVKSHSHTTYVDPSTGFLKYLPLVDALLQCMRVYYDSDYFTSAWQSPNSPLSGLLSANNFQPDAYHYNLSAGSTSSADEQMPNTKIVGDTLSQQQLRFLRAFDNYVRRNNLVGYREFNAIYAQYGIKPSEMKSNYSQLIDIRNLDLNVGDVTATADTGSTELGAYAGKGIISGNGSIQFEANDFGYFLQLSYLTVRPSYFQGFRRHTLRQNNFDFYNPDFDGVGPQPISKIELNSEWPDNVFGFTERYNEYRTKFDEITGDFALDPQMYAWHAGRYFNTDDAPQAQSNNLISYLSDKDGNSEYDRIFAAKSSSRYPIDHFYLTWEFKESAFRKMKNINEALGLGVGHVQLDRNGSI